MADGTIRDTARDARERFLLLETEARRRGIHIGIVPGSRHVWVATLHEPTGERQMAWLMTILPWGTHRMLPAGIMARVDPPSPSAAFWGELARGQRDLAAAATRLHLRISETRARHADMSRARSEPRSER